TRRFPISRGPCPFRAPPGRPCSRSRAAFRATSTRILVVPSVLYSPLCLLLREQRTDPSDSVAAGGPEPAGDAARRAASRVLRPDLDRVRRRFRSNGLPSDHIGIKVCAVSRGRAGLIKRL